MRTLGEVAAAYDTDVMREAYSTAYLLILLHQRRKEEDTRVIGDVLQVNSVASILLPHNTSTSASQGVPAAAAAANNANGAAAAIKNDDTAAAANDHIDNAHPHNVPLPTHSEFSWLGDLMIDMPSLQNFDLDQFLTTDVPWPLPEMGI